MLNIRYIADSLEKAKPNLLKRKITFVVADNYLDRTIGKIRVGDEETAEDLLDDLRYYGFLSDFEISLILRGATGERRAEFNW